MSQEKEIEALKRALEREKEARKQAERIMEEKSMELYLANQRLLQINESLENTILERTKEMNSLARFPEENPYPIFRFAGPEKSLLYSNKAGKRIIDFFERNPESPDTQRWYEFLNNSHGCDQPLVQEFEIGDHYYQFYSVCYADHNYMNVYGFDITLLKETQHALTESEVRFRSMVENASDIIYRASVDGIFTYVNVTAETITGYSTDELLTMHFGQLIRPDQQEIVADFYAAQIREKIKSTYLEFPIYTKYGNEKWIGQHVQLIMDDDNHITEVFSLARDITERKQAQTAMTRTATRLSSLIANLQAGVVMEDENQNIVVTNHAFCKLFDLPHSPSYFQGKANTELFFKIKDSFSDPDTIWNNLEKALQQNKPIVNQEVLMSDGRIMESDIVPIFQDQKFLGHLMLFRDITEKKEAHKILQRSEEKYRSIIENMYLGLLQVDNEENIMDVNNSMCQMLGYTKEELVGHKTTDLLGVSKDIDVLANVQLQRNEGKSSVYEMRVKRKDNSEFYVFISGAPLYNEKNEKIGSLGIHLDITQRKELEQDLMVARTKAEESAHAKEIFLANMSHEIRTPMNAILGMTNLLMNSSLDSKQLSYLDAIKTSSNNLMVIINDILDFSKIEAGKLSIEKVGIEFHKVMQNVINQLSFRADEKNILLINKIDHDIPDILVTDPTRLTQIFLNLLSNAVKFTHKGSVTLKSSLIERRGNQCRIHIQVIDTGIGIDADKISTVFDSFSQEDASTTRKYGGSGLGLTITRQLVELFGGRIQVKSKKGVGTEFYFVLPFEIGNVNDLPKDDSGADMEIDLRGTRVLVAEDHQINQFLAKTILESWGVEVTIAENGLDAVNAVSNMDYDIILMDMQMPEMDGLQATREIRHILNRDIPIIALTANAVKGDQEKCLDAGMNDYLSKPFEQKDLQRIMQKWIGERKSALPSLPKNEISQHLEPEKSKSMSSELYDLTLLNQLALNDEEFIAKMKELFISSTPEIVEQIFETFEGNEFEKMSGLAHKLKPSIDTFNIHSLKETIRKIEKFHTLGGSKEELSAWLLQLKTDSGLVIEDLKRTLEK